MATYNYYPANYQPAYYQPFGNYYPQNYQQMPQPVQNQQQSNQQQTTGILWVSSELEAQAYPVAPNNAVALWDSTKPAIYLKQADASGKPVMKVYQLSERTETPQVKQDAPEYKVSDLALKSDLAALEAVIATLKDEVKSLKRKKREVIDDDE